MTEHFTVHNFAYFLSVRFMEVLFKSLLYVLRVTFSPAKIILSIASSYFSNTELPNARLSQMSTASSKLRLILAYLTVKGSRLETLIWIVGYPCTPVWKRQEG